jgi:hypothetical protein
MRAVRARAVPAIGFVAACALALAVSILGSLFLGAFSLLGGPIVAGIVWAALDRRARVAIPAASATALVGVMLARRALGSGWIEWLVENGSGRTAVHPAVLTKMLPGSSAVGADTAVAVGTTLVLAACAAWLASMPFRSTGRPAWLVHVPAAALILIVIAGMVSAGTPVEASASSEKRAEPGSFSYDAAIYRQTHVLMVEEGLGFYDAFVEAASHDSRLESAEAVQDGEFVAWAYSPDFIRLPYVFWLWRAARGLGLNVYQLAMVVAALLLAGSYWAFWRVFATGAVVMPAVLFPWFVAHTTWVNLFFPDFWAGMFVLAAVMLALRKRWWAAGAFALAAALCREVAAIWLVILVAGAVVALRTADETGRDKPRARRDIVFYGICFVGFAIAVWAHRTPASALIAATAASKSAADMLIASAGRPLYDRFLAAGGHNLYPYGFFLFPPAWLSALAPLGYWLSLREGSRRVLLTVFGGSAFWLVFTLTIGASSSYWGQQYTSLSVLGSAAVLVWAAQRRPTPRTPALARPEQKG